MRLLTLVLTTAGIASCGDSTLIKSAGEVGVAFQAGVQALRPQPRLAVEICERRILAGYLQRILRGVALSDDRLTSTQNLCIEIAGTVPVFRSTLRALTTYARGLQAL